MDRITFAIAIIFIFAFNSKRIEAKNWDNFPKQVIDLSKSDSLILNNFWQMISETQLEKRKTSELILIVAERFLGTPYVAGTLDQNKKEQLVINLHGLDCVTYVETIIALSQTIKGGILKSETFFQYLQNLRYRDGILDGYASRLHYFSDWLLNNQQKGILKLVSDSLGDADMKKSLNVISKNRAKNTHLADSMVFAEIKNTEELISQIKLRYITKQHLPAVEQFIQDGDIIAITTSINGLDILHTGIALRKSNRLFMIHASSTMEKVVISEMPLSEYLKQKSSFTGVLIGRIIGN